MKSRVSGLERNLSESTKNFNAFAHDANVKTETTQRNIDNLATNVNALKDIVNGVHGQVTGLHNAVDSLNDEAKKAKSTFAPAVQETENTNQTAEAVHNLSERLDEVSQTAANANRLSRDHSSRLSRLNPEVKIAALEKKVGQHEKTLSDGEEKIKEVEKAVHNVNKNMEKMREKVSSGFGKIQALEETLK